MKEFDSLSYRIIRGDKNCTSDGSRIIGQVQLQNLSTDQTIHLAEGHAGSLRLGWRLQMEDGRVAEGRIAVAARIAAQQATSIEITTVLPRAMSGAGQLSIDLIDEGRAWLGLSDDTKSLTVPIVLPQGLGFDAEWYAASYGLAEQTDSTEAFRHFAKVGQYSGNQPSPLFSQDFVAEQIARLAGVTGTDFLSMYLAHARDIDPHPLLPRQPWGAIASVLPSDMSDSYHSNQSLYILRHLDRPNTRHSVFFDPDYIRHPDGSPVEAPLQHYLTLLWDTDARTSVLFDPEFYLAANPDVRRLVNRRDRYRTAFQHFLRVGMRQGLAPIPDLDLDFYRSTYPEVATAEAKGGPSAVEHFFSKGIMQGYRPNAYFDTDYYLKAQPDVMDECRRLRLVGPFEHFLKLGYARGYKTSQPIASRQIPDWMGKASYEKRCHLSTVNLLREDRRIRFPEVSKTPALSCIIPVFNHFEMTINLLRQLEDFAWRADTPEVEVIVVDNGSTDLTDMLSDSVENIRILRCDAPMGYTRASNFGAAQAKGRNLLFLNNDIETDSHSLMRGVGILDSDPDIGAVGGQIVLMNGQLQEAGGAIFANGGSSGTGRLDDPTDIRHGHRRKVDYISGCFLFVRHADFKALNGFDEAFSPGYYEEVDLCFRLQDRGLSILYDPSICVYHYEYATFSKGRPPQISTALMARNRDFLIERHHDRLATLPQPGGHPAAGLRDKRLDTGCHSIALVEDFTPDRRFGSGFVRTADLIDSLLRQGHRVTLFVLHFKHSIELDRLRTRGVQIIRCYMLDQDADPLAGMEHDFDLLWVCRTHNFRKWADLHRRARQLNPDMKLVFDTEAVSALRDVHYRKLNSLPQPVDLDQMIRDEVAADEHPDAIVAVNGIDRRHLARLTHQPIPVVGLSLPPRHHVPGLTDRAGLFFCGSFHAENSPNYDSLSWFLQEVWPLVRSQRPEAEFRFAGYCGPDVSIERLIQGAEGVQYLGLVENLNDAYDSARLFIAPTRYAGGIPHKICEAMASGLPTVCTALLARQVQPDGVPLDAVPLLYADHEDPQAWAALCLTLLEDDETWHDLSARSAAFVARHVSDKAFDASVALTLDMVLPAGTAEDRPQWSNADHALMNVTHLASE